MCCVLLPLHIIYEAFPCLRPGSRRRECEEPFLLSRNVLFTDNLKQEKSLDGSSTLPGVDHRDSKVDALPLYRSISSDSSSLDSDLADFSKEIDEDLE